MTCLYLRELFGKYPLIDLYREKVKGSVTAPKQRKAEGLSVLNRGIGKVLCSLLDFLCLSKMTVAKAKPAKCEVCAVLQVITAKPTYLCSVAAINQKTHTLNGPVLWTKGDEL